MPWVEKNRKINNRWCVCVCVCGWDGGGTGGGKIIRDSRVYACAYTLIMQVLDVQN